MLLAQFSFNVGAEIGPLMFMASFSGIVSHPTLGVPATVRHAAIPVTTYVLVH